MRVSDMAKGHLELCAACRYGAIGPAVLTCRATRATTTSAEQHPSRGLDWGFLRYQIRNVVELESSITEWTLRVNDAVDAGS